MMWRSIVLLPGAATSQQHHDFATLDIKIYTIQNTLVSVRNSKTTTLMTGLSITYFALANIKDGG